VHIHQFASQPIVESLGLEAGDTIPSEDGDTYVITPEDPTWIELDHDTPTPEIVWEAAVGPRGTAGP